MSGPERPLDIVIVNWNSGSALARCLRSLAEVSDLARIRSVVVVDNHSSDDSLRGLPALPPALPLTIRRNPENMGFAAACNQGAAHGSAPYLLFLNPDTAVRDGAIRSLLSFMEDPGNLAYGIAGAPLLDEDGTVSRTCARFPSPSNLALQALGLDRIPGLRRRGRYMREWPHDRSRPVDQIMGACLLIRRGVFRLLGGFDERFFVYWEDVDLCRRAARLGHPAAFVSGPGVYHEGGVSSGTVRDLRLFYSLRSRIQYGRKHFSPMGARVTELLALHLEPALRLVRAAATGSLDDAQGVRRAMELLREWHRQDHPGEDAHR